MCGIIGEVSASTVDIPTFTEMRDELSHRGPDGADLYTSDDGTTALGFRRLAIIDLSDDGMQPMVNEDRTAYLLFNGEIYNFRELRDRLESSGHTFTSDTDSEVILHGYEEWGEAVVEKLRGMFAFAVWDEAEERLFAARDRFGIKPFYFFQGDGRFVFASELKAILADKSVPREISPTGLGAYLQYGYIPAPYSIWDGIKKLVPGEYLVYEDGAVRTDSYWEPTEYVGSESPSVTDSTATLTGLLRESVTRQLVSDVPLGVLLSGGIDSSTVAALATESVDDLSAFSMGFTGAADELEYARRVATELGLSQTESELGAQDIETLFDSVMYYYDEPLADTSIFPTYRLMERVSDEFKVALAGDGGDELFAGYSWYDKYLLFSKFQPLAPLFRSAGRALDPLDSRLDSSLLQSLTWRATLAGRTGLEQYVSAVNFPIPDGALRELLGPEYAEGVDTDYVAQYASEWNTLKGAQCFDLRTFLPSVLTKVDRASMANSLEVRVPLLDRAVAEYSLSLDESLHYRNGEKKHLLKRVARQFVSPDIVDRPKSGFGAPISEMGIIESYVDCLYESAAAADGVFDQERLRSYVDSDPRQHNLFRLILFEQWYRRWARDTSTS